MKSSMRDNIEGKIHQVKGQLKEAVGNLAGDSSLKAEGKAENAAGVAQEKIGQIKKVVEK